MEYSRRKIFKLTSCTIINLNENCAHCSLGIYSTKWDLTKKYTGTLKKVIYTFEQIQQLFLCMPILLIRSNKTNPTLSVPFDLRIRRTSNTRTRQFLSFSFGYRHMRTGQNIRLMWCRQNSEYVSLHVQIGTRTTSFNFAFEFPVVSVVASVGNKQIVDTLVHLIVYPGMKNKC